MCYVLCARRVRVQTRCLQSLTCAACVPDLTVHEYGVGDAREAQFPGCSLSLADAADPRREMSNRRYSNVPDSTRNSPEGHFHQIS